MTPGDRQSGLDPTRFKRWRALIVVAALAVHLPLGFFKYTEPTGDAAEYHALAMSIVSHGTFAIDRDEADRPGSPTARRMPLYPLFLAALYACVGQGENCHLVVAPVQALLMVCNIALIMALTRRFFSSGPALLAGVLATLYQPYLFHFPAHLLSETLYLTLLLLALYLLTHEGLSRTTALAAGFGMLGLLILTRANAVFLLPALMVWAWRRLGDLTARKRRMGLLLLCLVLPLTPWWVRNAMVFERFIPFSTNGGWNFYLGHNAAYSHWPGLDGDTDYAIFDRLLREGRTEPQADHELYARGLAYIRSRPGETAVNLLRKAVVVFSVTTLRTWSLIFLAMILAGIHLLRRPPGRTWRKVAGGLLVVAGFSLWAAQVVNVYLVQHRGVAGVGVSFGLLAMAGVAGLVIAVRARYRDHWLLVALFLSQIAACLVYIPIVRIRWTVDFVTIIYAAVAIRAIVAATGNAADAAEGGGRS